MRTFVLALALAACTTDQTYAGHVVDSLGTGATNVAITLVTADWRISDPSFDDSLLARPAIDATVTGEDGRFSLDHAITVLPTQTLADDLALAIEPAGVDGPIQLQRVPNDRSIDLGTLVLPPTLAPTVDAVELALDSDGALTTDAMIWVDQQGWNAASTLPLAALGECPSDAACAHEVFATWKSTDLVARTARVSFVAAAPQPLFRAALDQTVMSAAFLQSLPAATLFIEGGDANQTQVRVQTEDHGEFFAADCASYGTGLRCSAPPSTGFSINGTGTLVRVF